MKNQSVFLVLVAVFGFAGCGGSSSPPARDGGLDVRGTGGVIGQAGASGSGGSVGGGGAGGTRTDGGADTGAAGGSAGTGGSPGDASSGDLASDRGADTGETGAADVPVGTPDATVDTTPDVIVTIDGGPTVVACPMDVTTAACTSGGVCVRPSGEACGCVANGRWLCPGIIVGTDGGVTLVDAGADAPTAPTCPTSAMTGAACTTEGEICRIPGSLGCGCLTLGNSLRWVCR